MKLIEKVKGKLILYCDNCSEMIEFDNFDEALEYTKLNGWELKKIDDLWINICPECQTEVFNDE